VQYAMLIYTRPGSHEELAPEEYESVFGEYMTLANDDRCSASGQLQDTNTASVVRVQDGHALVTDGPYAETKEVLGGFYVLEASDLDEALELAARIPAARLGGAIEVRPLVPGHVRQG
jgi:hypothetical protein